MAPAMFVDWRPVRLGRGDGRTATSAYAGRTAGRGLAALACSRDWCVRTSRTTRSARLLPFARWNVLLDAAVKQGQPDFVVIERGGKRQQGTQLGRHFPLGARVAEPKSCEAEMSAINISVN